MMGLRNPFRRKNKVDSSDAVGLGGEEGDFEPGLGGPSFFRQELSELRWAAQNEALNVARTGIDPTRWIDGRLSFDYERGLAHGYSGLRDRLANIVGDRIREESRLLYDLAADVGDERVALDNADALLVTTMDDWETKHKAVYENQLDLDRYLRLKSTNSTVLKLLVAAVFIVSEFIISGRVFERLLEDLPPGLGYVLAFGVTLALILIPHYAALGLKDGITQHHLFEKQTLQAQGLPVPAEKERAVHTEEKDDKGFRWAASIIGIGLLILIIPLSVLRVSGEGDGFNWWSFFFLTTLQYVLSGYFFLREWLDHGQPSHSLHMSDQIRERAERRRASALTDLGIASAAFHDAAEDLIFTVTQAPRWDSYIVSSYYETIRYCRHLIRIENPEFEQFITWANVPYLGTQESAARSGFPVEPLSHEHMVLDENGFLGREWWLRTTTHALTDAASEAESRSSAPAIKDSDISWLATKSPDQLLETFLKRYYGLPLLYEVPEKLKTLSQGVSRPVATPETAGLDIDTQLRQFFGNGSVNSGEVLAPPPTTSDQSEE